MASTKVPSKEDFDWLLFEMTGFMRTQILAVAASLRLAEHLQDGGQTPEDFAAVSGIEPSMAFRFLRACTKIGLTACDYYAYHPEEAAIFRATMQSVSEGVASEIARMLDTSAYSVAVDVGGADGALVHSLMQHNPHLRGIVLDRPGVAAAAAAAAEARGLADRTEAIGGDFFKSVPEGDLYLLRFILHDWDDADAIRILESCRRAMKADARLVVIEAFFAEPGEQIPANMIDTQVALFDLHLMLAGNGKERSLAEYSVLFEKVGLRTIKTTPLDNGYVVIETAAV
jgi:hypothetical protein